MLFRSAGYDVPELWFERCQLYRKPVDQRPWRRRLASAPLLVRLEWAMTAHELERNGVPPRMAERVAWRTVEPQP